jgi:hypothetical protein
MKIKKKRLSTPKIAIFFNKYSPTKSFVNLFFGYTLYKLIAHMVAQSLNFAKKCNVTYD